MPTCRAAPRSDCAPPRCTSPAAWEGRPAPMAAMHRAWPSPLSIGFGTTAGRAPRRAPRRASAHARPRSATACTSSAAVGRRKPPSRPSNFSTPSRDGGWRLLRWRRRAPLRVRSSSAGGCSSAAARIAPARLSLRSRSWTHPTACGTRRRTCQTRGSVRARRSSTAAASCVAATPLQGSPQCCCSIGAPTAHSTVGSQPPPAVGSQLAAGARARR
mmetsp:Transcript_60620/g.166024  ORF Transcript_60620/g.166024 Transcript_60620/m.166024 type:complete len:216 (-) Transcript_60620:709-1356(-)